MPPKKSYESHDSESDEGGSGGKRQKLEKNSAEYQQRRARNNLAVKKSREASRRKAKETMDRLGKLRNENQNLEQRVTTLNKELLMLRDLFLTHAAASQPGDASGAASGDSVEVKHSEVMLASLPPALRDLASWTDSPDGVVGDSGDSCGPLPDLPDS